MKRLISLPIAAAIKLAAVLLLAIANCVPTRTKIQRAIWSNARWLDDIVVG